MGKVIQINKLVKFTLPCDIPEEKRNEKNNIVCFICKNGDVLYNNKINGVQVEFYGMNNTIIIYEGTKFNKCKIKCGNNMNILIMESSKMILNLNIMAKMSRGGNVFIGKNFQCFGVTLKMQSDKSIFIGSDCMMSGGIFIWNTDGHAILDENLKCINKDEDVIIGRKVWIGHNVEILKGVHIQHDSVVGSRALVTNKFIESNVVIAGIPAKIVRHNITWSSMFPSFYEG